MLIKILGKETEEVVRAAMKSTRTKIIVSHMGFFDKIRVGFKAKHALSISGNIKCKNRIPTNEEVRSWISQEVSAEQAARLAASRRPSGGCGCGFR